MEDAVGDVGPTLTGDQTKQCSRSRRWAFTLNNYTELHETMLKELVEAGTIVTYLVYGRETGAAGTPHLQGYLELKAKKGLTGVKKIMNDAHWEIAKGTAAQNLAYCSKQDNKPFISGSPMVQGARTDLYAFKEALDNGANMMDLAELDFGTLCRNRRALESYHRDLIGSRDYQKPTVICRWGESGSGKTRFIYDNHPPDQIWCWGGDRWFDGYVGQEIALFDDFDGSEMNFRTFLRVLDRYAIQVPVKGAFVAWRPKIIYITSNYSPRHWFKEVTGTSIDALIRRIDETLEIKKEV